MKDYEEAVELIADHLDEADFEAQPEARVARAEQALGLRLPPSYRRFLLDYGSGGVGAEEIYGLVDDDFDDPRAPGAVGLTRELRRQGHISNALIVIYSLGQGSYFALDTAQAAGDGEAPVVMFTPGLDKPSSKLDIMAKDFGAFFLETVQDDLS